MTSEEKAEKYCHEKCKFYRKGNCDAVEEKSCKGCNRYEDYLEGHSEGRKETELHLFENWCRNEDDYCPHLKRLEKENAELKAQIPKWHDLRKDPNDLPRECQNVLCLCYDIGCKYYCTGHLIYKTWFSNTESKVLRVTAWFELPKFEEN